MCVTIPTKVTIKTLQRITTLPHMGDVTLCKSGHSDKQMLNMIFLFLDKEILIGKKYLPVYNFILYILTAEKTGYF